MVPTLSRGLAEDSSVGFCGARELRAGSIHMLGTRGRRMVDFLEGSVDAAAHRDVDALFITVPIKVKAAV